MRTGLISFLLFGIVSFCCSQHYLKQLLDEMPDQSRQNQTALPVKSEVPSAFGPLPANVFIGISDPAAADTLRAMNQAYARAIFMYALQSGKGRGMTDFFHKGNGNDEVASNYEELCELRVSCQLPLSQCSFESYHLASGEIMVLLTVNSNIPANKALMLFNGDIELYSKEIATEGGNQSISRFLIDYRLTFQPSELQLRESYRSHADSHKRRSMISRFDGFLSDFENYRYFYQPDDTTDMPLNASIGAPVYHGLWYALMTDLFRQISQQYLNEQVRVKKVGDQHNANLISLNRETGFFDFRVIIQHLLLKNNTLHVMLKH